jgi:hypothetical protein
MRPQGAFCNIAKSKEETSFRALPISSPSNGKDDAMLCPRLRKYHPPEVENQYSLLSIRRAVRMSNLVG